MALLKVNPHHNYQPEDGRYVRGRDSSPVAVVIILNAPAHEVPLEIDRLVSAGIEGGAALSETLQTENIGIEKIVCNVVANPNIRYLIVGGPESEGHLTGEALKAFLQNGVDDKRRIIGTNAPVPLLLNLPVEYIDRFLTQVSLVDLQFQKLETLRTAIRSACKEKATEFLGHTLFDPGAINKSPLDGEIIWRYVRPWTVSTDVKEIEARKKVEELIIRLRDKSTRK